MLGFMDMMGFVVLYIRGNESLLAQIPICGPIQRIKVIR